MNHSTIDRLQHLRYMVVIVVFCGRMVAAQNASSSALFNVAAPNTSDNSASVWSRRQPASPNLSGSMNLFRWYDLVNGSGSHFGGLAAGYNHRTNSGGVVGVEGDISFGAEPVTHTDPFNESVELFGTVRGRLGYANKRWLSYGTGGLTWTRDQFSFAEMPGAAPVLPHVDPVAAWRVGWTVGTGIERTVGSGWSAKAEYLYSRFGNTDITFPSGARVKSSLSMHQVRIGVNHAVGDTPTTDHVPPAIAPLDMDHWTVHGQTTYVSQYAPPFRAPYRGANSLDPNTGRETWDVSFYLGRRLWTGAALWLNPEIDQGFGLSNTLGVAGFTSGEAYKVGHTSPYVRIPRAFVQQTFNLGGPRETIAAGLDQFEETQTANRVVVTIGKVSVSDYFDTISYAHDPRSDFMNWSLVDAGTFDYAADAWGFTYGAAVEWDQRSWTARVGVFDLSSVPNSVDLDAHFHQIQMVYELDHRHVVKGQSGLLALVGFMSRGRMGRYDDALALAQQTGAVPDTADVRRYNSRPGVNVNISQQLGSAIGVFGRIGSADGYVEPYEFTDIDRTASAGVSLNGDGWGRHDDRVGLATVFNGISDAHRAYLARGGLGILVGDGRLPHAGIESIVETYYRTRIAGWQATADYQFVVNPAFNGDRGPVSVFSLRLHAQF
jgi:high affinity Mn2+ porin